MKGIFLLYFNNCFNFRKHLDTMANVTDCGYGKTNFLPCVTINDVVGGVIKIVSDVFEASI